MGSNLEITMLSDVHPFKTEWSVQVKILHMWKSFDTLNGSSLQMVLADENGWKIQARCKQSLMQKLDMSDFCVGKWKVISNFSLVSASGFYKPTHHFYKMDFLSHTSVIDSPIQCDNMFLALKEISHIKIGLIDKSYLIDVIGEVLDYGGLNINYQTSRKEVASVEFTLRDIKDHRIQCCLHGKLAESFVRDVKPNNGNICLLRYAKICNFKGDIRICNGEFSLVMINPPIKESQAINQMFYGSESAATKNHIPNINLTTHAKEKKWGQTPFKTIQEMKRSNKGEICRVMCTVYAVDTSTGWYYFTCVVCNNKVSKTTIRLFGTNIQKWWCESCQLTMTNVVPRYKLDLLVQDQTGESTFTLQDSVSTTMVKSTASRVVNLSLDEVESREMLPPEIVSIVGKNYGFGVSLDETNKETGAEKINAMKVWGLNDITWKYFKWLHGQESPPTKKQCKGQKTFSEDAHKNTHNKESG